MAKKDKNNSSVPTMTMGCDLLDLLVGGAPGVSGLPFGTILNIIGDSSSGKTFLKNEIIASNYWKLGGPTGSLVWESDDCESGDTLDTVDLYGFEIHPNNRKIGSKVVDDSDTIETLDAKVSLMLESMTDDTVGIYAVDSLDGLSDATKEAMASGRLGQLKTGKDVKDPGNYGMQIASFLSQQFFRTKHKKLEDKKLSLIIISQVRENIGAGLYAQKTKSSNGKALEFYCHTRIQLTTVAKIRVNELWVGSYVKATTIKSKTKRPMRTIYYIVYFDYGIDNIGTNIDYLFDLRDDKGKLLSAANSIVWNPNAKLKTSDNLKDWLVKTGLDSQCKNDRKLKDGTSALSSTWILEWVKSDPMIKEQFDEYFGTELTRDELIRMCESSEEMKAELTRRVREKWESTESKVATNRLSKYRMYMSYES